MTEGPAEGGVISKGIKRIIDENQKKQRVENTALRDSSLDRKRL